jgi:hypothetical protein
LTIALPVLTVTLRDSLVPVLLPGGSLAAAGLADEVYQSLGAVLAADDPQQAQHPAEPDDCGRSVQPAQRGHDIRARDHHADDDQPVARVPPRLVTQFPAQGPGTGEQPERIGCLIAAR